MRKLLVLIIGLSLAAAILLTIIIATIVALGGALQYFMPTISFEFAGVLAALAILIAFLLVITFLAYAHVAHFAVVEPEQDEQDDEEYEDLADKIAEIVSDRLEPHFVRKRRAVRR